MGWQRPTDKVLLVQAIAAIALKLLDRLAVVVEGPCSTPLALETAAFAEGHVSAVGTRVG